MYDNTPMTPAEIAALHSLMERAGAESWTHVTCDDGWQFIGTEGQCICHQDPNYSRAEDGSDKWDDEPTRNRFALIVAAKANLPRLLALAERVGEMEEALDKIAGFAPGHGDPCEIIARIARAALHAGGVR